MKIIPQKSLPRLQAFTLVELLIVIAIIGILAAMLLPVINVAEQHAKKTQAKLECGNIVNAIQQYEADYSRFPVSSAVQSSGFTNFTYGGVFQQPSGTPYQLGTVINSGILTNSDVISILLDETNYLNGWNSVPPVYPPNVVYQKNPKQIIYLANNTHFSSWDPSKNGLAQPGIGNDLVYRDPWGNPYVITLDLNDDNNAVDTFYGMPKVGSSTGSSPGSGLVGLVSQSGFSDYSFHGNVMVWSAGPGGQVDPASTAIQGANKNHVLSWQ